MKKVITLLSLTLVMVGCMSKTSHIPLAEDVEDDELLDRDELMQLLPGSTIYQKSAEMVQVGFYAEDNTMVGNVWGSWIDHIDKGTWMVNDKGQFCNSWLGSWSDGQGQRCFDVYSGDVEDQYLLVLDSNEGDVYPITILQRNANEFE